jgi:hypothetical protein
MRTPGAAASTRDSFTEEAERAIEPLRSALGAIVDQLPGEAIVRPSQLADVLNLDAPLAWRISKVVSARDPFLASQYVPGPTGLRNFLRAAARCNVSREATSRAKAAFDDFRRVMKTHAGDRSSFEAMLAGHVTEDPARVDLAQRKAAFRPLSYIWGVQARTHLHTYVIRASDDENFLDLATLRGFVDLRWIRPDVPWRISRPYTVDVSGRLRAPLERAPLSPGPEDPTQPLDLPLMYDFCSRPLPPMRRADGSRNDMAYQLVEGSVGNTGSLTCFLGEIIRGAEPRYRQGEQRQLRLVALPRTPCQALIFDVLIHRDAIGRVALRAEAFSDLFDREIHNQPADFDRLPLHECVERLGSGGDAVRTPEVPRYPEMIRYALEHLGWPEQEFDVYRLRVPYPPIPTMIRIAQDLPEA